MSFCIDFRNPNVLPQTIDEAREMLQSLLDHAEMSDSQREGLEQAVVILSQNIAPRYVYRCEPQWGDAEFDSLEEMTGAIRLVCDDSARHWDEDLEEMVPDYEFPEGGLREGRDYVIQER